MACHPERAREREPRGNAVKLLTSESKGVAPRLAQKLLGAKSKGQALARGDN